MRTPVPLQPVLESGVFAYCSLASGQDIGNVEVVSSIVEPEGLSVIVRETVAIQQGWPVLFRVAWIRFGLESALDGVGLTAAVSRALAAAGIGCNMVAGAYHDHVFVPVERATEALGILGQLRVEMTNKE